MADITMTYASLEQASSGVNQAKADLDEVIALMDKTVGALEGNWSGASYNAFVAAWNASKPTMQSLSSAVAAFAPELTKAVEEQKERENVSAGRMQNLTF